MKIIFILLKKQKIPENLLNKFHQDFPGALVVFSAHRNFPDFLKEHQKMLEERTGKKFSSKKLEVGSDIPSCFLLERVAG